MSEVVALNSEDWADRIISGTTAGLLNIRSNAVEDLAAASGIASSTLYRKLRGGRWKAAEVKHVADAFNVPVGDLFDGRITPGPSLPKCAVRDSNPEPAGKRPILIFQRKAA